MAWEAIVDVFSRAMSTFQHPDFVINESDDESEVPYDQRNLDNEPVDEVRPDEIQYAIAPPSASRINDDVQSSGGPTIDGNVASKPTATDDLAESDNK